MRGRFNTAGSSNSIVDLLQKRWSRPQLHGFRGVPQWVLHQLQVLWSWEKLPTTPLVSGKMFRLLYFSPAPIPLVPMSFAAGLHDEAAVARL
jgi:hypothetical protein